MMVELINDRYEEIRLHIEMTNMNGHMGISEHAFGEIKMAWSEPSASSPGRRWSNVLFVVAGRHFLLTAGGDVRTESLYGRLPID